MALLTILHPYKKFERPFLRCHALQPCLPLPKLQTAEKDFHAAKANHPKEVFDVILPADHESTKMMKPSDGRKIGSRSERETSCIMREMSEHSEDQHKFYVRHGHWPK